MPKIHLSSLGVSHLIVSDLNTMNSLTKMGVLLRHLVMQLFNGLTQQFA